MSERSKRAAEVAAIRQALERFPPMEHDRASDADRAHWFGEDIAQVELRGRVLDVGWYGGDDGVFGCRDLDAATIAPESWQAPPELVTKSTAEARKWFKEKVAALLRTALGLRRDVAEVIGAIPDSRGELRDLPERIRSGEVKIAPVDVGGADYFRREIDVILRAIADILGEPGVADAWVSDESAATDFVIARGEWSEVKPELERRLGVAIGDGIKDDYLVAIARSMRGKGKT